jgi:cytochrome P450
MTLPYATYDQLKHIPGEKGLPLIGDTLNLLSNTLAFGVKMREKHGNIYRNFTFGRHNITMAGAEITELVLFDKDKVFSSSGGWNTFLEKLFPRGLMLRDFEDHRLHRKAMAGAFKTGPMQSYLKGLDTTIKARVAGWKNKREMRFYDEIKQLTLDLAASSFWGDDLSGQTEAVKAAFISMIAAATAPIRVPLPFTKMKKGVDARARIIEIFSAEIPKRRESTGDDLLSELCRARLENGELLSVIDIVDHMSFFLMAAHDTLTSSMSSFIYHLALYPEWQTKLRDEVAALNLVEGESFPYEKLNDMPLCEMAFKEALRLYSPVPGIPRQSVKDFTFQGFAIPKGTMLNVNLFATHYMEELWPEPHKFDPMRFTPEEIRARHKYAWMPYSGGAHTCLGMNFAYMQAKCFIARFLPEVEVSLKPGYVAKWQILPIPKPSEGLPITLKALK